jgi:opacity protein-like surface antigen
MHGWEFTVTPYFWGAGMDGDATIKGVESSVDLSFGDILEDLDFGAMAHLEARNGKWGFFLDPSYVKLATDGDVGPFNADVETEMILLEFGVLYRLIERPIGAERDRTFSLDLLGGARYADLEGEIDVEGPLGINPSFDGNKDWIDPIVGGIIQVGLTENLAFRVRGDIGGFDIGSGSDFAWNVVAGVGYTLSERTTLWLGYRILDVDYDDGSGSDLFEYDISMSGPIAGLSIRF